MTHGREASSSWVKITGCELDYLHAGYRHASSWRALLPGGSGFRIAELLFPARLRGSDAPARLVVATRDPRVLAIAERAFGSNTPRDQESFLVTMLQVVTAMRASRELEGAFRGPIASWLTRPSLSAITSPVAGDAAVLDLQARPGVILPGLEMLAGLMALWPLTRWKRGSASAGPTRVRTGPQLLLLNLYQGAPLDEIECAPPLGSQKEVRAIVAASLPGIAFDERGKGTFTVRSGSVDVDVRNDEPAYTAVVTVWGNASPAVARLLEESGWVAYAPRIGAFVSVADLRPGSHE